MVEFKNAYTIFVGGLEGKGYLEDLGADKMMALGKQPIM